MIDSRLVNEHNICTNPLVCGCHLVHKPNMRSWETKTLTVAGITIQLKWEACFDGCGKVVLLSKIVYAYTSRIMAELVSIVLQNCKQTALLNYTQLSYKYVTHKVAILLTVISISYFYCFTSIYNIQLYFRVQ